MTRRFAWLFTAALLLAGCASAARVDNMIVIQPAARATQRTPLTETIAVGEIRGGRETNPLWKSEVGNEEFRQALRTSLLAATYLAPNEAQAPYVLEANLLGMSHPIIAASVEVTTHANYVLRDKRADKPVFLETITSTYTAPWNASFLGVERLRLANEGSVRENINQLLQRLQQVEPSLARGTVPSS